MEVSHHLSVGSDAYGECFLYPYESSGFTNETMLEEFVKDADREDITVVAGTHYLSY